MLNAAMHESRAERLLFAESLQAVFEKECLYDAGDCLGKLRANTVNVDG